ncbi:MAG: glycosyltransferase family 4 protein [Gammaproteobacteria bacterium]|nr:glycosyltransferase family 4 protein [Gammaproteobacteria bacterium]
MRILFLTQWFDPEPTPKGIAFVKELTKKGHNVEVLTGIPNYPLGKYYDNYSFKIFSEEYIDGIRIIRAPIYPSHTNSAFQRIITYITFTISAIFFGIFATKKADIIYAYHPPNIGYVASVLSFFKRIPFVHDIQDLWPDSFLSTGMISNSILIRMIHMLCKFVYKRTSGLVVISKGFKKELIRRGVKEEKISVIYNWCDETKILSSYGDQNSSENYLNFTILFAGNMGKAQNLDVVLDAAKILKTKSPIVQFKLVGSGTELEKLKNRTTEEEILNVEFLPRQPMEKVGRLLKAADVLLVNLSDDSLFEITIPSKIQSYMAIGKPILMSGAGEPAEIVELSGSGLVVPPNNPILLAEAAMIFSEMSKVDLNTMGKSGRDFYFNEFSLDVGTRKLDILFKKIAQK